jgi:hypothetical protein
METDVAGAVPPIEIHMSLQFLRDAASTVVAAD